MSTSYSKKGSETYLQLDCSLIACLHSCQTPHFVRPQPQHLSPKTQTRAPSRTCQSRAAQQQRGEGNKSALPTSWGMLPASVLYSCSLQVALSQNVGQAASDHHASWRNRFKGKRSRMCAWAVCVHSLKKYLSLTPTPVCRTPGPAAGATARDKDIIFES